MSDENGTERPSRVSKRGFASMDPERRREIARKGGASLPAEQRMFFRDRELAASAGRKGGEAPHATRHSSQKAVAAHSVLESHRGEVPKEF